MLCSEASLVNHGRFALRAVSLKCRAWTCEMCQPMRQRQLVELAKSGKPTTFVTLTSNPKTGTSPASRARALAKAWPMIVKRACKKYGYKAIPYFCVFEATKRGEPHLHILARVKWLDQKWLSQQMRELTGAPIVDIREVKSSKQIAHYISKYIGKEPHRFATCKRYWRTQSWVVEERAEDPPDDMWAIGWYIVKRPLLELQRRWTALGYDVALEGHLLIGMKQGPPAAVLEGRSHG